MAIGDGFIGDLFASVWVFARHGDLGSVFVKRAHSFTEEL